jgi:hypothetical protein
MAELYDAIGHGYRQRRRQDPIESAIMRALGDADSVVNVGAGAGSYEPRNRHVVVVEPSLAMIRQRAGGASSSPGLACRLGGVRRVGVAVLGAGDDAWFCVKRLSAGSKPPRSDTADKVVLRMFNAQPPRG